MCLLPPSLLIDKRIWPIRGRRLGRWNLMNRQGGIMENPPKCINNSSAKNSISLLAVGVEIIRACRSLRLFRNTVFKYLHWVKNKKPMSRPVSGLPAAFTSALLCCCPAFTILSNTLLCYIICILCNFAQLSSPIFAHHSSLLVRFYLQHYCLHY